MTQGPLPVAERPEAATRVPDPPTDPTSLRVAAHVSNLAALLPLALGAIVLIGWQFDIGALKSILPGWATMKPLTAVCFMAAGASLWLQLAPRAGRAPGAARALSGLVVLVGALTLIEYGFDLRRGIDQVLFPRTLAATGGPHPGRMSGGTALGFALLGAALSVMDVERRWVGRLGQSAALIAALIGMVAMEGYLFDATELYRFAPYGSMASHTAALLVVSGLGILAAHPTRGILAPFTSGHDGGRMARLVLPVAVVATLVIGWLRLRGERAELFDPSVGVALFTTATTLLFTALIWLGANHVNTVDRDRRRAQARATDERERFRLVVEASPAGMVLVDRSGLIRMINGEAERLFGWTRDALVGQPVERLLPKRLHDEHVTLRERYLEAPGRRPMGVGRDLHGRRRDGTTFPVEIGLNPIEMQGEQAVLAVVTDITERRQAARAIAQRQRELERSNDELAQFAYVASHDLQEPLRIVANYTELFAGRYRGQVDERAEKYIAYIVDGARRMQQLVSDLLAYSRVDSQGRPLEATRTDAILRITRHDLAATIGETDADVAWESLPEVWADAGQLQQLFRNLVGNALKFRGASPPRIRIDAARDGAHWRFSVEDNGIGIAPEYRERIFGMFQRLHARDEYPGSGIGLSIARKIVERHGGRIWVESRSGPGTTVHFTLLAADGPLPEALRSRAE